MMPTWRGMLVEATVVAGASVPKDALPSADG